MRGKKIVINTVVSLCYELISIICGFILPRLILSHFGSSYNGITSSISQFLSGIVLLRAGIGGATRAALYSPLANRNVKEISGIMNATEGFLRKVALIFLVSIFAFATIYPIFVSEYFDWFFSFSLVIVIGMGTFSQTFFGLSYQFLLNADQRNYIVTTVNIVLMVINTIISAILINLGCGIHIVKLGSSVIYVVAPIVLRAYVRKKYALIKSIPPNKTAINQRWNALAHEVAKFIHSNTDIIVITLFRNINVVSVYTVYFLVINGVKRFVVSLSSGIEGAFGNMVALGDIKTLNKNFTLYEFIYYTVSASVFTCTAILIVPFVMLYTHGITDVDYCRPVFVYIMCFAEMLYCNRMVCWAVIGAVGHFKQTKTGAFIEAGMNIVLSVILVNVLGLVGVAIGTLCAMVFRTAQHSYYVSKHVLHRSMWLTIRRYGICVINTVFTYAVFRLIPLPTMQSYGAWFVNAIIAVLISITISLISSVLFDTANLRESISVLKRILKRKTKNTGDRIR